MPNPSLPPELLIEIIAFATGNLPSRDWLEYESRRETLRSLSLVNSAFRSFAQPLLPEEIWHCHRHRDHSFEELAIRLVQRFSQSFSIRHALVTANNPCIDGIPKGLKEFGVLKSWTDLVSLQIDGIAYEQVRLCFDNLSHHPHLEIPHLSNCKISVERQDLVFPNLLRLVLSFCRADISGPAFLSLQHLFSSQAMPKLVHLALESSGHYYVNFPSLSLFRDLLPQIRTLALRKLLQPSIQQTLPRMPNLQHLSMSGHRAEGALWFFDNAAGLKLKTLHIGEQELGSKYSLSEKWAALAKGEHETIKAEKVVIYGSKYWAAQNDTMAEAIGYFHWVITYSADERNLTGPLFLDFDGSIPAERFWLRR